MALPSNPSEQFGDAPLDDLMRVLLSQFKRLLADNGVNLTADETLEVAQAIVNHTVHPKLPSIREVTKKLVKDSLDLLNDNWGLTFLKSLYAEMDDIDNWDTTVEFLEIANEKSNAELRISTGASLLVTMGDLSFVPYLINVIHHDDGLMDVDAVFAKRALLHISQRDGMSSDWFKQVEIWLDQQ